MCLPPSKPFSGGGATARPLPITQAERQHCSSATSGPGPLTPTLTLTQTLDAPRPMPNTAVQAERRLMHRLVRKTEPGDATAVVSANMRFAFLDAVLFAGVSWVEGQDPMIQLVGGQGAEQLPRVPCH